MGKRLENLMAHYKTLGFSEEFYEKVKSFSESSETEFTDNERFLAGIAPKEELSRKKEVEVKEGDTRIDVPAWFGNLDADNCRILVLGKQPRHTNDLFNIERKGKKVFAITFAADRWNEKIKTLRTQMKYFKIFKDYLEDNKFTFVFSDLVKEYEVKFNDKEKDDNYANKNFNALLQKSADFLRKEIEIIQPHKIIILGAMNIDPNIFDQNIHQVKHPAQNAKKESEQQIREIINSLKK